MSNALAAIPDHEHKLLENLLKSNINLKDNNARYHYRCYRKIIHQQGNADNSNQRKVDKFLTEMADYFEANPEECQFTFKEICDSYEGDKPTWSTYLKERIEEFFERNVVIHYTTDGPVFSFRNINKLLTEMYEKRKEERANKNEDSDESPEEVRRKMIFLHLEYCAQIIFEDIRTVNKPYNFYDPADKFLENVNSIVPETLRFFLECLIQKNKQDKLQPWDRKITTFAHLIMQAVRPRKYTSNLMLAISAVLDKKFGSSDLITLLASLGLCSSYEETQLFLASILENGLQAEILDGYVQLMADNADWNTQTSTGYGTLHAMGASMSVTPETSVKTDFRIDRLQKLPAASTLGHYGRWPLEKFDPLVKAKLTDIKLKDICDLNKINLNVNINKAEFLWLFAKHEKEFKYMGWNSFMEEIHDGEEYVLSRLIPLPFVMAKATDLDTIYTVLYQAQLKCIKLKQRHIFVTFDLPLYIKAMEVKASCPEFENVLIRIGGFHWLMSFMGCIGSIMEGSGLQDVLNTVFALGSVDKILSGHAYARAVRAFSLINTVLASLILEDMEENKEINSADKTYLANLLSEISTLKTEKKFDEKKFNDLYDKFLVYKNKMAARGPTAKLWIQLFDLTTLIKQFIEAERTGNWQMHLDTCQRMIPFFCAAFHYKYAEYGYIYIQDMLNLKNIMDPSEYQKFTENGYFTIRRTDKFFSGIFTDQTIEQFLMRQIKIKGDLVNRNLTEGSIATWIGCLIALIELQASLSDFSGIAFTSSEQHKDSRQSKVEEDFDALNKINNFFKKNNPFPAVPYLMSISSGLIANAKISCHLAFENGLKLMISMVGKSCTEIKFKKVDKIVPLLAMESSIFVNGKIENINSESIFVRYLKSNNAKKNMQEYLKYELAAVPTALFDGALFRKSPKSKLYEIFRPLEALPVEGDEVHIIDGGYMLHKINWQKFDSYDSICDKYINYIKNFAPCIVFDGYPEEPGTKSYERARRASKHFSPDIEFSLNDKIVHNPEDFLSNNKNKNKLVTHIMQKCRSLPINLKIEVSQAEEDADALIVHTAIEKSNHFGKCLILGEDTDLLILITQLAENKKNIFLKKPSKVSREYTLYSSESFTFDDDLKKIALFCHAMCGCDSTSSFFNIGKTKIFQLLSKKKCEVLRNALEIFNNPDADRNRLYEVGYDLIKKIYSSKNVSTTLPLNEYRYYYSKELKSITLNLLPPTEGAIKKHIERVYYQCQLWLGENIDPKMWGWKKNPTENILEPIFSDEPMMPDSLTKDFICSSKTNCSKRCGCRKMGLKCNKYCKHCKGNQCLNSETVEDFIPEILTDEPEVMEIDVEPSYILNDHENEEIESDEHDNAGYTDNNESDNYSDDEPPFKILKM